MPELGNILQQLKKVDIISERCDSLRYESEGIKSNWIKNKRTSKQKERNKAGKKGKSRDVMM